MTNEKPLCHIEKLPVIAAGNKIQPLLGGDTGDLPAAEGGAAGCNDLEVSGLSGIMMWHQVKTNKQGSCQAPPRPRLSLFFLTARQLPRAGSGWVTAQDKTKLGVPAEVSSRVSLPVGQRRHQILSFLRSTGATEPESPELGFGDLHLHPHLDHHA